MATNNGKQVNNGKQMKSGKWFLGITCALLLSACGSGGDSSEVVTDPGPSNLPLSVLEGSLINDPGLDLVDTQWFLECFPSLSDEQTIDSYQETTMAVLNTGTQMQFTVSIYDAADSTCEGNISNSLSATYQIDVDEKVSTLSGVEAYTMIGIIVDGPDNDIWPSIINELLYRDGNNLHFALDAPEDLFTNPNEIDFSTFFVLVN